MVVNLRSHSLGALSCIPVWWSSLPFEHPLLSSPSQPPHDPHHQSLASCSPHPESWYDHTPQPSSKRSGDRERRDRERIQLLHLHKERERGREGERERERKRERKRGTYSAGLFCCGELSSMWKDLQTRANSKAMERGRHLVSGCGQWVWSHTYTGTQRTRGIFNVKTLMVALK